MFDEYDNLRSLASENPCYWTLNGKDVLWLPVQVPHGVSVLDMLNDLFSKYKNLINNYNNFEKKDVELVNKVCDSIINIMEKYLTGDTINAYESFSKMMDSYEKFPQKFVESNILFYRMRKDIDLEKQEDFYHLPINMREKCAGERFSIAGYPCFYLGYSKNDCYAEISKKGSMIAMSLKESDSLKVLDLTFSTGAEKDFLKAFPLIASCYIVLMNNVDIEKAKFREEYVIPQMLTSYLKHKGNYDGICYYSVRNENLNPYGRGEEDYRNLVLFPKLKSSDNYYDMELMDKFHWYKPFNVK